MYYVRVGAFALVGCSPLPLFRLSGREIFATTDAGTRRSHDVVGDWVPTVKEQDEHGHIVEAMRRDMERICVSGGVMVESMLEHRRFSHVSHLFATLRGTLDGDVSPGHALLCLAPHSAVVGHPRAGADVVIVREELGARGFYGGAIAWVGAGGSVDAAAVLRSAEFENGSISMRSGAGIVAASDASAEFEECVVKSEPIRMAVAAAERAHGPGGPTASRT
jgi:anthranilate synthase component 1